MAALHQQGISPQQYALLTVVSLSVSGLIWVTAGIIIFVRKSADALALIVSLALVTFGTQTTLRGSLVEAVPALSLPGQILTTISWGSIALFFSLFPNGQFVPRWLRWLVSGWILLFVLPTKVMDVIPKAAAGVFFLVFWLVSLSAQIYRYMRVSTPVERQQTKWVFLGLVLLFAIIIPAIIFGLLKPEQMDSPILLIFTNFIGVIMPLSIGVAILKSRLWDIDVIVRKTLVYSVLTVVLALVYFGSVILLQRLFSMLTGVEQSPLAVMLSSLAIAALFTRLRRRIQDALDRRFFRKKYNAQQVLAKFAITARDETDLDALTAELTRVVQETLQPERVSVWLTPSGHKSETV